MFVGEPYGETGKRPEKSERERKENRRVDIEFIIPPKPLTLFPKHVPVGKYKGPKGGLRPPEPSPFKKPKKSEQPYKGPSVSELLEDLPPIKKIKQTAEKVAEAVDSALESAGVPEFLREEIRDAIKNLPETAAKKALQEALKDPRLNEEHRAIIRGAVEELLRYQP